MFNFELTLEEANLVLGALGKQPFDSVAALIANIRQQAEPQLERVAAERAAAAEAAEAESAEAVAE